MGWFSHKFAGKELPLPITALYEKRFGMSRVCPFMRQTDGCWKRGEWRSCNRPYVCRTEHSLFYADWGSAGIPRADVQTRRNMPQRASEDVVLPPLTAEPWVLTYLDITEDPTDWKNTAMAAYYGNASVRLETIR